MAGDDADLHVQPQQQRQQVYLSACAPACACAPVGCCSCWGVEGCMRLHPTSAAVAVVIAAAAVVQACAR